MVSMLMPMSFGAAFILGVSVPSMPLAQLQLFLDLNRELGVLCQDPPRKAMSVCRLHAKLVRTP